MQYLSHLYSYQLTFASTELVHAVIGADYPGPRRHQAVDTGSTSAAFDAAEEATIVIASFLHVAAAKVATTITSADHMDFAEAFTVENKLIPDPSSVQAVSRTASAIEMMDLWL